MQAHDCAWRTNKRKTKESKIEIRERKGKPVTEQFDELFQEQITILSLNGCMLERNCNFSQIFALMRFLGWGVVHISVNRRIQN